MIDFVKSVEIWHLAILYLIAFSVELILKKSMRNKEFVSVFLFNMWELLGIVFPVIWLLNIEPGKNWVYDIIFGFACVFYFGWYRAFYGHKKSGQVKSNF